MTTDIVIIGAGIIGLSSAYELAKQGASVTVLDRGEVGMEASWAGGGILFPLLPWDYRGEVTALTGLGASLYPAWMDALQDSSGIDPEYVKCGMRVLSGARSMQNAPIWCERHGVRFVEKDGEFMLPDVAQVRNPRLIRALGKTLENMGVTILCGREITALEKRGQRISGIKTADGTIYSGQNYVVCAGAWSNNLIEIRSFPVRGQMLLFEAEPGFADSILLKDDIYLVPRRDGHILVGSTIEYAGFDKSVTAEAAGFLHESAAAILPELGSMNPVRQWAGLRPGSIDNIPVICRHPDMENLYINSGHFRYGVTMAPASARILSSLFSGEAPPLDIGAYNCQR
ncbi:MAG: glycine oxidase ThiO [Burkholderiales bacterium]|nr:glycine oxidase ThiO [Burkholderiales bacterium]